MVGDSQDFRSRLRAVLPLRWFPDESPVLDTVLCGLAQGWSWVYDCLAYVRLQGRISTASGVWLDVIARDYFAPGDCIRNAQSDDSYRGRILAELLRERVTRSALRAALEDLTGRAPVIFEPANPADTGAYGSLAGAGGGCAYAAAGGWGSLLLPFQSFVTAYRPNSAGISTVFGWDEPSGGYGVGIIEYASLAMVVGQVTDADINRAIAAVLPAASICWARISS